MKAATKKKAKALARVPQSREDAVFAIGRIGTLRREIQQLRAQADDTIRLAGEKFEQASAELVAELTEHEQGVQVFCEARRLELTNDGKVKFHDFGTGRINWKLRPPRVSIRAVEAVIEACKKVGFPQFVRVKEEVNKDAMLADPDKARLIAGVTISSAGEEFVIEPAELESSLGKA
ncbi:host-nuclease inhibitor Gam family protein [Shinella sp.]|uniref:host-nuclease inhibitor Gam family protein n=1 Tax=Shinella sp. TaxID=1870904 RepID=UPI0039E27AB0